MNNYLDLKELIEYLREKDILIDKLKKRSISDDQIIKMYQKRIDKAIEYMEKEMIDDNEMCYKISQMDVKELLSILKGEEDE